jgi:hypothetical protein
VYEKALNDRLGGRYFCCVFPERWTFDKQGEELTPPSYEVFEIQSPYLINQLA